MAFSSSNLELKVGGGLSGGVSQIWLHRSTETSTQILGAGFFAGVGAGSRGNLGMGVRVGDLLLHRASTDAAIGGRVTSHSFINSTANQSSTTGSTGWNAAYDMTVCSAT